MHGGLRHLSISVRDIFDLSAVSGRAFNQQCTLKGAESIFAKKGVVSLN